MQMCYTPHNADAACLQADATAIAQYFIAAWATSKNPGHGTVNEVRRWYMGAQSMSLSFDEHTSST